LATDLDIGFIDAGRAAMGLAEETQSLLDQGRVSQNPSIECTVIDVKAAFQDHLEMGPLKSSWELAFQFHGNGVQDHGTLH
jgi:hypothetical protein